MALGASLVSSAPRECIMRVPILVSRLAAAGALSAVAVVSAAGTATAGPSDDVNVQPDPVTPGSSFSVYGMQCAGDNGMARFKPPQGGTELPDLDLGMLSNALGATGNMPADAVPGTYRVTLLCDGETYLGTMTVADADPASPSPSEPTAPPGPVASPDTPATSPNTAPGTASPTTAPPSARGSAPAAPPAEQPPASEQSAVPKGGVETGVGGSNQSGNTVAWAAGGAVALALVGGALWYRRQGQA